MPSGIVLLLSVPVFYVWGIIAFVRWLSSFGKKSDTGLTVAALQRRLERTPDLTVRELVAELSPGLPAAAAVPESPLPARPRHTESLSHWYSDNSISLLLYVGAFLIVASASLLVGFQWGTLSGMTKALVLLGTTLAFLVGGAYVYPMAVLRTAGAVFMSIGNLLIPFAGYGWYAFVWKGTVDGATVWMVTSIVSACMSAFIGFTIRNRMYSYLTAGGILSFFLALVNLTHGDGIWYVVGAQSWALIMYTATLVAGRKLTGEAVEEAVVDPVRKSTVAVMPPAVAIGMAMAVSQAAHGTGPCVMALLAAVFYAVRYAVAGGAPRLVAAALLMALVSVYYGIFSQWTESQIALAVAGTALAWLVAGMGVRSLRPAAGIWPVMLTASAVIGTADYLLTLSVTDGRDVRAVVAMVLLSTTTVLSAYTRRPIASYCAVASYFVWVAACYAWTGAVGGIAAAVLSVAAYVLFVSHFFEAEPWITILRRGAYAGIFLFALLSTPKLSWFLESLVPQSAWNHADIRFSSAGIIVMVLSTVFFILESIRTRRTALRYVASFLFMYAVTRTLELQLYTDWLAYSIPWGAYLLSLAFFRRRAGDRNAVLLDGAGLFMLVAANIPSMMDAGDPSAAVIVGAVGLLLLVAGISWRLPWYQWAGVIGFVLAVIARTYRYVLGMEKWMVTAVLGLVFLVGAVYLLTKKPRN